MSRPWPGIRSFMDEDSLKPGEQAWETMLAAVRQCCIAIPVLSESYGNSVWCLRELAAMVEAKRHVMPLFLDDNSMARSIDSAGSASGWRQNQMSGFVELLPPMMSGMPALSACLICGCCSNHLKSRYQ
ncbi:hypothetical protein WJX74_005486 [Apatococcus lobatus]|uniref:ADP-ribosyl cyclase/cyclic ADP-ribose hydrolase n=1 Tax=Apatococcus lobatus TaxID=904363 RepID=A0AAW1S1J1_9CHLO